MGKSVLFRVLYKDKTYSTTMLPVIIKFYISTEQTVRELLDMIYERMSNLPTGASKGNLSISSGDFTTLSYRMHNGLNNTLSSKGIGASDRYMSTANFDEFNDG